MDSLLDHVSLQGAAHTALMAVTVAVTSFVLYSLGWAFYNLYLHPLREDPGPLLWRMSSFASDYHTFNGTHALAMVEIHQKYGPIVRVAPDELSYTDSRVWKDVWNARTPEWPKDPRRIVTPPNGYHGILTAPRDEHARFRRLLAHAFSEKGLRDQEPRIRHYVDLLIDRLDEKAQTGESTDMVDWFTITVFDVIGDLAWGEPFHGLRDRYAHEWIPAILGNIQYNVETNVFTRWGLGRFKGLFVSPATAALKKKNYTLAGEKARLRASYGSAPRGDFWDRILIKSADDNAAGEGMIMEEMVNNASVLVLAGAETSATTLSGATYLLLKHPEIMKKLLHEIRTTFQSSKEIDVYSVNRLPYLLAVLDEAMRIYAPVPDPARRVPPSGGGMVCGKFVPEGTTIHAHQLAANHMPTNFHQPESFIPERWLATGAPPEFANDNRAVHQPFSVGNRNCIGKNLAYTEMRLVLAKVLYNFDLQLDEARHGDGARDWLVQKSYGVWVKGPLFVRLKRAGEKI